MRKPSVGEPEVLDTERLPALRLRQVLERLIVRLGAMRLVGRLFLLVEPRADVKRAGDLLIGNAGETPIDGADEAVRQGGVVELWCGESVKTLFWVGCRIGSQIIRCGGGFMNGNMVGMQGAPFRTEGHDHVWSYLTNGGHEMSDQLMTVNIGQRAVQIVKNGEVRHTEDVTGLTQLCLAHRRQLIGGAERRLTARSTLSPCGNHE